MERDDIDMLGEPMTGRQLAMARGGLGMTQTELGNLIGITQSHLSALEREHFPCQRYVFVILRLLAAARASDALITRLETRLEAVRHGQ